MTVSSNPTTYSVKIPYFYNVKRLCNDPTQKYYRHSAGDCVDAPTCTADAKHPTDLYDYCDECHYTCETCNGARDNNCTDC